MRMESVKLDVRCVQSRYVFGTLLNNHGSVLISFAVRNWLQPNVGCIPRAITCFALYMQVWEMRTPQCS